MLFMIIYFKCPKVADYSGRCLSLSPSLKVILGWAETYTRQIKSVKDKSLALRVKDPAKCSRSVSSTTDIMNVHEVQISRAHQLANVFRDPSELFFPFN